jgi:hypothetical protein
MPVEPFLQVLLEPLRPLGPGPGKSPLAQISERGKKRVTRRQQFATLRNDLSHALAQPVVITDPPPGHRLVLHIVEGEEVRVPVDDDHQVVDRRGRAGERHKTAVAERAEFTVRSRALQKAEPRGPFLSAVLYAPVIRVPDHRIGQRHVKQRNAQHLIVGISIFHRLPHSVLFW